LHERPRREGHLEPPRLRREGRLPPIVQGPAISLGRSPSRPVVPAAFRGARSESDLEATPIPRLEVGRPLVRDSYGSVSPAERPERERARALRERPTERDGRRD